MAFLFKLRISTTSLHKKPRGYSSENPGEKAQGKYTGRKPIPIDWERFGKLYGEWKAKNITGRDFMQKMELSANTFYRRVREYEKTHGITEPISA